MDASAVAQSELRPAKGERHRLTRTPLLFARADPSNASPSKRARKDGAAPATKFSDLVSINKQKEGAKSFAVKCKSKITGAIEWRRDPFKGNDWNDPNWERVVEQTGKFTLSQVRTEETEKLMRLEAHGVLKRRGSDGKMLPITPQGNLYVNLDVGNPRKSVNHALKACLECNEAEYDRYQDQYDQPSVLDAAKMCAQQIFNANCLYERGQDVQDYLSAAIHLHEMTNSDCTGPMDRVRNFVHPVGTESLSNCEAVKARYTTYTQHLKETEELCGKNGTKALRLLEGQTDERAYKTLVETVARCKRVLDLLGLTDGPTAQALKAGMNATCQTVHDKQKLNRLSVISQAWGGPSLIGAEEADESSDEEDYESSMAEVDEHSQLVLSRTDAPWHTALVEQARAEERQLGGLGQVGNVLQVYSEVSRQREEMMSSLGRSDACMQGDVATLVGIDWGLTEEQMEDFLLATMRPDGPYYRLCSAGMSEWQAYYGTLAGKLIDNELQCSGFNFDQLVHLSNGNVEAALEGKFEGAARENALTVAKKILKKLDDLSESLQAVLDPKQREEMARTWLMAYSQTGEAVHKTFHGAFGELAELYNDQALCLKETKDQLKDVKAEQVKQEQEHLLEIVEKDGRIAHLERTVGAVATANSVTVQVLPTSETTENHEYHDQVAYLEHLRRSEQEAADRDEVVSSLRSGDKLFLLSGPVVKFGAGDVCRVQGDFVAKTSSRRTTIDLPRSSWEELPGYEENFAQSIRSQVEEFQEKKRLEQQAIKTEQVRDAWERLVKQTGFNLRKAQHAKDEECARDSLLAGEATDVAVSATCLSLSTETGAVHSVTLSTAGHEFKRLLPAWKAETAAYAAYGERIEQATHQATVEFQARKDEGHAHRLSDSNLVSTFLHNGIFLGMMSASIDYDKTVEKLGWRLNQSECSVEALQHNFSGDQLKQMGAVVSLLFEIPSPVLALHGGDKIQPIPPRKMEVVTMGYSDLTHVPYFADWYEEKANVAFTRHDKFLSGNRESRKARLQNERSEKLQARREWRA